MFEYLSKGIDDKLDTYFIVSKIHSNMHHKKTLNNDCMQLAFERLTGKSHIQSLDLMDI